jgi:hypothetical protein
LSGQSHAILLQVQTTFGEKGTIRTTRRRRSM